MAKIGMRSVLIDSALSLEDGRDYQRVDLPRITALYAETRDETICLLSADLCVINRMDVFFIRQAVAEHLKMDWSAVHLYLTHTHAPGGLNIYKLEQLSQLAVSAAVAARDTTREVSETGFLRVDTQSRYSINRRAKGGGMGAWCLMQSAGCSDNGTTVDGTEWARIRLKQYGATEDELKFFTGPCIAEKANDSDLDLMLFCEKSGGYAAGIVRFAAHAVICSAGYWKPNLNRDYPGVLCDSLSSAFGCPFMFLQGPCGDLRPRHTDVGIEERDRIGRTLANELIKNRDNIHIAPFDSLRNLQTNVLVPVREDLPSCLEEAEIALHGAVCALKAAPHGSFDALKVRKRLGETKKFFDKIRNVKGFFDYLTVEERRKRQVKLPVSMLELGDIRLLQFPGELLSSALDGLKSIDGRPVVTASYVDGVAGYIMPEKDFEAGGYETTSMLLDVSAAGLLRATGEDLLAGRVLS